METTPANPAAAPSGRLDSWKEIAAYLKRDVRTVQRWEKEEGLPVHRLQHGKQGTVYAQPAELDAWWVSRRRDLERTPSPGGGSRWLGGTVVSIAALLVSGWIVWQIAIRSRQQVPTAAGNSVFQFQVVVADNAGFGLDVSADGRRLIFDTCCTDSRIFVHEFESSTTRPLRGAEGGIEPVFSPDGMRVLFRSNLKLKIVDLRGGPTVTLCDASFLGFGASWHANGLILFSSGSGILRIPAAGGSPEPVSLDDGIRGEASRQSPRWLPDGRHFIYHLSGGGAVAGEYLGSIDQSRASRLVETNYPAVFAPPASVLFLRGPALMAQAMNLRTLEPVGEPELVASDVAPGSLGTPARFAASATGVLAFMGTRGGRPAQLAWFDRSGAEIGRIPQPDSLEYLNPALSPDGRFVAVNRMDPRSGHWDVWTIDLARNIPSRATFNDSNNSDPVWSPDGKEIIFVSDRGGQLGLYRTTIGGQTDQRVAPVEDALILVPTDWSSVQDEVIYTVWKRDGGRGRIRQAVEIRSLLLNGSHTPQVIVRDVPVPYGGRLSPDGKWIAFNSLDTGESEIFIQPLHGPGQRQQISTGGGVHPRWTGDGREIVYWTPPRGLSSAMLTFTGGAITATPPKTLLDVPIPPLIDGRTHWDMSRDGRRFLVRHTSGIEQASFTVVVNWPGKLTR